MLMIDNNKSPLVPGLTNEYAEAALARQTAVQVHPNRDVIAKLPPDVQRNLRLRAIHAPPRSLRFTLDNESLALLESEIALELAQLWTDCQQDTALGG